MADSTAGEFLTAQNTLPRADISGCSLLPFNHSNRENQTHLWVRGCGRKTLPAAGLASREATGNWTRATALDATLDGLIYASLHSLQLARLPRIAK